MTELHWQEKVGMTSGKSFTQTLTIIKRECTVGPILSPFAASSSLSYECISYYATIRKATADIHTHHHCVLRSPTAKPRLDDVACEDVYNQMDNLTSSIPKHDVQLVIEDMNSELGNGVKTKQQYLGPCLKSCNKAHWQGKNMQKHKKTCYRRKSWAADVLKPLTLQTVCQLYKIAPPFPLANEGVIEVVDEFSAYCSADGTNAREHNHRLGKASGTFRELSIGVERLCTKMKFYVCSIYPT